MGKIDNAARCLVQQAVNTATVPAVAAGAAGIAVQEVPAPLAAVNAVAAGVWASGSFWADTFVENVKGVAGNDCPDWSDIALSLKHAVSNGVIEGQERQVNSTDELGFGTPDWFDNK